MLRTINIVATTKEVKIKKRKPMYQYDEELRQQIKTFNNREHNGSITGKITTSSHMGIKEIDTSAYLNLRKHIL